MRSSRGSGNPHTARRQANRKKTGSSGKFQVWNALAPSFQGLSSYHRVVRTTKPAVPVPIPWDDGGVTVGSRWGHGGVPGLCWRGYGDDPTLLGQERLRRAAARVLRRRRRGLRVQKLNGDRKRFFTRDKERNQQVFEWAQEAHFGVPSVSQLDSSMQRRGTMLVPWQYHAYTMPQKSVQDTFS